MWKRLSSAFSSAEPTSGPEASPVQREKTPTMPGAFDPSTEEGQLAKAQCDALLRWYNEYVLLTPPFFLKLTYV